MKAMTEINGVSVPVEINDEELSRLINADETEMYLNVYETAINEVAKRIMKVHEDENNSFKFDGLEDFCNECYEILINQVDGYNTDIKRFIIDLINGKIGDKIDEIYLDNIEEEEKFFKFEIVGRSYGTFYIKAKSYDDAEDIYNNMSDWELIDYLDEYDEVEIVDSYNTPYDEDELGFTANTYEV